MAECYRDMGKKNEAEPLKAREKTDVIGKGYPVDRKEELSFFV